MKHVTDFAGAVLAAASLADVSSTHSGRGPQKATTIQMHFLDHENARYTNAPTVPWWMKSRICDALDRGEAFLTTDDGLVVAHLVNFTVPED